MTHVDLYLRAVTPAPDRHDAAVAAVTELAAAGAIDGYRVHTWPPRVRYAGRGRATATAREATDDGTAATFERFAAWADRAGVSVEPPFDVRTIESTLAGTAETVLITPERLLAVSEGDELLAVYPHVDDDGVHTLDESLSALAAAADAGPSDDARRPVPAGGLPIE